jgi:hypothetical protein
MVARLFRESAIIQWLSFPSSTRLQTIIESIHVVNTVTSLSRALYRDSLERVVGPHPLLLVERTGQRGVVPAFILQ